MDISSERIHSLLPVFLVTVLGASAMSVDFIEGLAEATDSIAKVFSGVISDRVGRRKPLVLIGYGMAALRTMPNRRHHDRDATQRRLRSAPSDGYGAHLPGRSPPWP